MSRSEDKDGAGKKVESSPTEMFRSLIKTFRPLGGASFRLASALQRHYKVR